MLLITALRSFNFFNESGTGHITAGIFDLLLTTLFEVAQIFHSQPKAVAFWCMAHRIEAEFKNWSR
jgi:hypothetical protein